MDEFNPYTKFNKSRIGGWSRYSTDTLGDQIDICEAHIDICEDLIRNMQGNPFV